MSLKDIEKLREKVEKDPNSKLFVPLAEEYKKEGMLDEAISVLMSGLEKQPGYTSARVSLGKIYLEKGMYGEATAEFEKVIRQIPDNLYAHKKLAEIYKDTGKTGLAIKSFRAVLKLNPLDEDAISKLKEIEGEEHPGQPAEERQEIKESFQDAIVSPEEETTEETPGISEPQNLTEEAQEALPPHDEELAAFKSSLFGSTEEEPEKQAEAVIEEIIADKEEEKIEILEEPLQVPEEEISFGDIGEALEYVESEVKDIKEEIKAEVTEEKVSIKEKEPDFTEPSLKKLKVEDADQYISSGSYLEAMKVYREMLSSSPDDRKVLQRIEELRTLMKLMGKDKELLISKLNTFLEGVNKRRDEFLRSP